MEIGLSHWMDLPPPLPDDDADYDDSLMDDNADDEFLKIVTLFKIRDVKKLLLYHDELRKVLVELNPGPERIFSHKGLVPIKGLKEEVFRI
ncbi:hypothetical protein BpHYR1_028962 [Brachionus plicatilis]|uniref:Uncharacterized protein n=1 Tax=Brachionus plicatilis TaxID=10195 RepID=A0A3M7SFQ0_BRAPC|nr:hypothetical protein BpHYR1_028962 [Brachionus plicatilis]